jgi:hypothetical protein
MAENRKRGTKPLFLNSVTMRSAGYSAATEGRPDSAMASSPSS